MAPQINLFSYERSSKKLEKPFVWATFEPEHQNFLLFIVAFIDAGKKFKKNFGHTYVIVYYIGILGEILLFQNHEL